MNLLPQSLFLPCNGVLAQNPFAVCVDNGEGQTLKCITRNNLGDINLVGISINKWCIISHEKKY